MIIKTLTLSDLYYLTKLHYEVLPNEFLTSISPSFLTNFYSMLFKSKNTAFLGAFEKNELIGAIVGIGDNYRPTLNSYFASLFSIIKNLPRFLSSKNKIKSLFQSFIFKIKNHQETEIFFIGVDNKFQNQGIGKKLLFSLEKYFKKKYPCLYVDCKNKLPSNSFYKACGFKPEKKFTLYGETWNHYKKKL